MKVGVIGLGGIAQKAYLPVLTAMEGTDLVFCTRNRDVLTQLAAKYRIQHYVQSLDEIIEAGVDCAFLHTATPSHVEMIEKLLLNGIHVYVDKPIANHYKEVETLANLAHRNGKILMAGFNRRFAPLYASLKKEEKPQVVLMQKNRVVPGKGIRDVIFDDFIHIVDTLCFLLERPSAVIQVHALNTDDKLLHIVLQLTGQNSTAVGMMNRNSGANEELLEYMSPGNKLTIRDMAERVRVRDGQETISKFGDWDATLFKRGFQQIVEHFLTCVHQNDLSRSFLDDAVLTHEICEKIVCRIL